MWEEATRKYSMPHAGINSYTEDLHAWSIYRQNLNADFSESALGVNKSSNSERPFGNFQLKETTVNNILNHPKYGPKIKNQDAFTYLRFGLPRVKASQSEIGNSKRPNGHQSHLGVNQRSNGVGQRAISAHPMGSDSSNQGSECSYSGGRKKSKRIWKSDPDLLRSQTESAFIQSQPGLPQPGFSTHHYQKNHYQRSEMSKPHVSSSVFSNNHKAQSESDLRFGNGIKNDGASFSHLEISNGIPAKHPHLIVRNLYYEIDKSSTCTRICGLRRKKLKILDNITFDVRSGEILALMATNGE